MKKFQKMTRAEIDYAKKMIKPGMFITSTDKVVQAIIIKYSKEDNRFDGFCLKHDLDEDIWGFDPAEILYQFDIYDNGILVWKNRFGL